MAPWARRSTSSPSWERCFGVAVSLGLGSSQVAAGLSALFGWSNDTGLRLAILGSLTIVATISIVAGLDKGVKLLSNVNIGMAVGLMLFVLVTGSTLFLLRGVVETIGLYLSNLPRLAFWNDMLHGGGMDTGEWGWQGDWTVFYWAWTVTWSPFIGLFVARISLRAHGPRIRLWRPAGAIAVHRHLVRDLRLASDGHRRTGRGGACRDGPRRGQHQQRRQRIRPLAMFAFFAELPWAPLMQGLAVLVVAIFFATSSDSASLVVDMLCTGTAEPGPVRQRVFWGLAEGAIAGTLILLAGEAGLTALQEVITVVGLPIFLLVSMMIPALIRGFAAEEIDHITIGKRPALSEFDPAATDEADAPAR